MSASSRSETVRGTITANGGVVTLPLNGLPAAGLTITGTWTGTLQVEETFDGDTWSNCKLLSEVDVVVALPLTANQIGLIKAQGRAAVRVRASAWTSGSAVVVLNATEGQVGGSSSGGGGSTDPTAPNAVELSDGTVYYQAATQTTAAAIKAKTDNLDVALSTRTKPADQQHAIVDSSALPTGASTEATLASVLAKIIAAPATEATLASILAKIIAAPATEATLALIKAKTDNLDVALSTRTKPADAQHTIVDSGTISSNSTLQAATVAAGNVGGLTKTISSILTRPANTTTYTANDEMTDTGGAIRTLTGAGTVSGGKGIITHCFLSCSSNGATKPTLTVYVYDTTSTPQTDNAAFAPADAVQDTAIGSFTLTSAEVGDATAGTGNFTMDSGQIHIPYTTVGGADLFFRVKVTNGYTPGANSDTNTFRFHVQQDAN